MYMAPCGLETDQLCYLREHLRICPLYGLLRPFEGVTPYRWEMQARLQVDGVGICTPFGDRLAGRLAAETDFVLNLASNGVQSCSGPICPVRPVGQLPLWTAEGAGGGDSTMCKMARTDGALAGRSTTSRTWRGCGPSTSWGNRFCPELGGGLLRVPLRGHRASHGAGVKAGLFWRPMINAKGTAAGGPFAVQNRLFVHVFWQQPVHSARFFFIGSALGKLYHGVILRRYSRPRTRAAVAAMAEDRLLQIDPLKGTEPAAPDS